MPSMLRLGNRKGIQIIKIWYQESRKILPWETLMRHGLNWSDLWKSRPVKDNDNSSGTAVDLFGDLSLTHTKIASGRSHFYLWFRVIDICGNRKWKSTAFQKYIPSGSRLLPTYLTHPNPCFAVGSRLHRQWSWL